MNLGRFWDPIQGFRGVGVRQVARAAPLGKIVAYRPGRLMPRTDGRVKPEHNPISCGFPGGWAPQRRSCMQILVF